MKLSAPNTILNSLREQRALADTQQSGRWRYDSKIDSNPVKRHWHSRRRESHSLGNGFVYKYDPATTRTASLVAVAGPSGSILGFNLNFRSHEEIATSNVAIQ